MEISIWADRRGIAERDKTMKRRRFLKYLSGAIPFVGGLAILRDSKGSERQPETLKPGQVWKGKCLASQPHPYFKRRMDVEFYYIIIDSESPNNWWRCCEYSHHAKFGTNMLVCMFPAERLRKLTYLGHLTELGQIDFYYDN